MPVVSICELRAGSQWQVLVRVLDWTHTVEKSRTMALSSGLLASFAYSSAS